MIIAFTGGKGGTGKSTVATALALEISKEKNVLLIDADVDCPNDHLLLGIDRKKFRGVHQRIPEIDLKRCIRCGECGKVCKTKAIVSIKGREPLIIPDQCNGCGSCKMICPERAISWDTKQIGVIYEGRKGNLDLLSGELEPNQPISERIVARLNKEMKKRKAGYDLIIIDTAAGTHCPVIEALKEADKIFAVTEPTPLGAHDLGIILEVIRRIGKEAQIIINRSDIGDPKEILELSKKTSSGIIMEIPYSTDIARSYSDDKGIAIQGIIRLIEK
jgi:MinD superfamily P-loop ATPase